MSTAGPAAAMPTPVPRKSPAPIAEPSPIMVRWRVFSPRLSETEAEVGAMTDAAPWESCEDMVLL